MISTGFITFTKREIYRFLVLYKQTIIPGLLSSLLYIIVFGTTLGSRINLNNGVDYINFIIPGLTMMTIGLVLFAIIGIVLSFYLMYWLIIELPVLVRIKHNELYNKWR